MSKYKLILFDFDMTLIDSLSCARNALRHLNEDYGLSTKGMNLEELFGRTFEENAKFLAKINKGTKNEKTWQEIMHLNITQVHQEYLDSEIVDKQTIQEIKVAGIKIGIISNSESSSIRACLANKKNKELKFDVVLGFNDKKSEETKSHLIQRAMKELKFSEEETLYVGDHYNDILAAKRAGIDCAAISTGITSNEELAKYQPKYLIKKLSELKEIVL